MPKYSYLRLKIPSLSQHNAQGVDWNVWCGRTAGSMLYNYYAATREPGGLQAAKDLLIRNKRDAPPYDLVYCGGPLANQVGVPGYGDLLVAAKRLKGGWIERTQAALFPLADPLRAQIQQGRFLDEAQILAKLGPLIRALEGLNPALMRTSLSHGIGLAPNFARHLVVVSGYRIDAEGALWLHIDDPSSTAWPGADGTLTPLPLAQILTGPGLADIPKPTEQLPPDSAVDDRPGRRYWLRAAVLFRPNDRSVHSSVDLWGDHQDEPGLTVDITLEPEKIIGSMVELSGDPRYPLQVKDSELGRLWEATASSGDPYPLSARRSWHNGIHIPPINANEAVHPIAPGRAVLAWFPEREPKQPDRGMVVMRHAFDPRMLRFVDARSGELPEGAIWVYSLYANLRGGHEGADAFLKRIHPGPEPALVRSAEKGTPTVLVTATGETLVPVVARGLPDRKVERDLVAVAGTSRLALREVLTIGVELTGTPWIADGGVVKVSPSWTGTTARVYLAFTGQGASRSFPNALALDVTIEPSTTLPWLEKFTSNLKERALVEMRWAVDTTDNQAQIDAWQIVANEYAIVRDLVCQPKYADLADEDLRCLDFVEEPIGLMGVQRDDGKHGVHVEVFAAENFAAEARAGGRWSLLDEIAGLDNGTAEFFKQHLGALLSTTRSRPSTGGTLTQVGHGRPTTLLELAEPGHPLELDEWLRCCANPHIARELSQVVARHRSEWTLDLVEDPSNRIALRRIPESLRKALFPAEEHPETYYYFHPLRVIEWLRTGIDVGLHHVPKGASLVLALGGEQFDLVRQDNDIHRLRVLLGDADASIDARATDWVAHAKLQLVGFHTKHEHVHVALKRHQVTRLSLTDPGGESHTVRAIGSQRLGLAVVAREITLAKGEENVIHLPADRPGPLDELACSKAQVVVEGRYNVMPPDTLKFTVPGGFEVAQFEVAGAQFERPAGGWKAGEVHELPLTTKAAPHPDDLVSGASSVVVSATLVPASAERTNGSVEIEISGGDLVEPVDGKWEIDQRDIAEHACGHDVAKLQLYLSQILCGTTGCLPGPGALVDGEYGKATGLALWRFQLRYPEQHHASAPVGDETASRAAQGARLAEDVLTLQEIEKRAAEEYRKHGGPTVTRELLDRIKSFYRLPHIAVACSLEVAEAKLRSPIPEVVTKWSGWSAKARSRVVPLADALVLHVRANVTSLAPGDLASVKVKVELVEADAYRLDTQSTTTLDQLVAHGVKLVPSGRLDAAKAKPRLVVRTDAGAEVATLELGGATDVRAPGTESGLDAAMIQAWLKARQNAKKTPYFGGNVDGSFGDGSKSALDRFGADNFPGVKPEYPALLEQLRTIAPAAQKAVGQ